MYRLRFSIYVFTTLFFLGLSLLPTLARADLIEVKTDTPLKSVYHFEDYKTDDVRVETFFIAGEADWDGQPGLSHYLEHLMYWHANKAVSGDEIHGRRGNAWVNGYVTNYHTQANKEVREQVFDFGRALLDPPDLDETFMLDERGVVVREYKLRYQDNPDYRIYDQTKKRVFGDNPAGRSVIGNPTSIMALTIDDAIKFHSDFYTPANMVLIVVGAISQDDVKAEIEKRFSGLEAGTRNEQTWRQKRIVGSLNEELPYNDQYVAFDALQFQVLADWSLDEGKIDDHYVIRLALAYLNSAVSGSPAKALRTQEFVFSDYSFWLDHALDKRVFMTFAGRLDKGVEHEAAIAALRQTMVRIGAEGISEKSLERLRKRLIKEATRRGGESDYVLERAANFISIGVPPNNSADDLERLSAVTKQQVDDLLRSLANPERQAAISILTEKKQ